MSSVNIYRMDVSVIDMEGSSICDVVAEVERSRYYSIRVHRSSVVKEDWTDDHPLNRKMTYEEYEAWWATK